MILNDKSTDEQIVGTVLSGDSDSFGLIVNRYQSYIFSIGMRLFKNEDDSLDFVQDVFLKAFNQLKSYKGKASFRAWFIKVAYNYGINILKAKKIENAVFEESLSDEPTPAKDHERSETIELLRGAIDSLPENYRVCVDLYFFMGLKYIEIESITGFPVNTIKSNVLRAKQILRDELRGSIAEDYHEM